MKELKKTQFWTLKKIQLLSLLALLESILLPFQAILLSRFLDSMGFSSHRKDRHDYFMPNVGVSRYPIFDSIQEVAQIIATTLFVISICCFLFIIATRWLIFVRKNSPSRIRMWVTRTVTMATVLILLLAIGATAYAQHFEYDTFLYNLSELLDWNKIPAIEVNPEKPYCHDFLYNPCK